MGDAKDREKNGVKNGRLHQLLRDQRVLMGISLLLAIVVWLVIAVLTGNEIDRTIENVPVRADFSGTVAEELGLVPFWSGPLTDPGKLTVTVVVRCKSYEKISADTLEAVLVTGNEYTAKEHLLAIRVAPKKAADRDRFEIVSVTPASIPLYFDIERTREIELTTVLLGEAHVPEGYHAEGVILSKKKVSVTGPATLVDAIAAVNAQVVLDKTYRETAVFEDIAIIPLDHSGNTSPYLTVEGGSPEVNATLPVWKRASLFPVVNFQNVPGAYLSASLPVKLDPGAVSAALPEARIPPDLFYSVGTINFQALSPATNRFRFPVDDLKEIRIFDETDAFTAVVDMEGFDTAKLTLQAAQVEALPNGRFSARFDSVGNVTVVGPAEVVSDPALALAGVVEIPEDARPGNVRLPVTIRVIDREDCWVYGEYTVRVTITEI